MILSNFVLASGIAFLAAARIADDPRRVGVVVFVGLVLVVIACGLHLTAVVRRLGLPTVARSGIAAGCWLGLAVAAVWCVARAPGLELVVTLVTVPPVVGLIGLSAIRPDRWPALGFLVLSILLSALLAPVWVERVNGAMA